MNAMEVIIRTIIPDIMHFLCGNICFIHDVLDLELIPDIITITGGKKHENFRSK
jgi:hypothetical protein